MDITLKNSLFLELEDGKRLAYHKFESKTKNNLPGIIFFGGFKSDMEGTKALFLEQYCISNDINFIRFDYSGHGESSRDFVEGTIGNWKDDAVNVIDLLTEGPQIIIGSSMGGWIMLLAALERPERIHSLIGIAAAPDFTEDLIWNVITKEEQKTLKEEGILNLPSEYCDNPEPTPYPITYNLIKEARNHLLLDGEIDISCPITLIHGIKDNDVPSSTALKISKKIKSKESVIKLVKDGDHRMSSENSLKIIKNTIDESLRTLL